MSRRSFFRPPVVLATLTLMASAVSAAVSQGTVLSKKVPAMVQNGRAVLVSPLNTGERLNLDLELPIRNQAKLDALLADLYNPSSPSYHKWLSQPQFEASFGPTAADKKTLVRWAQDKGLEITYQSSNGRIVQVSGLVDTINHVFHVQEQTYHDTILDRDFHAPDREPTTDLSIPLLNVGGLENSEPKVNHHEKDPTLSLPIGISAPHTGLSQGSLTPTSQSGGVKRPNVFGSGPSSTYLPSDIRTAYYGNGNLTGAGQTVGVFSFDGYLTSDVQLYYAQSGFSSTVPVNNVLVSGYSGGCFSSSNGTSGTCDDGEQVLDIVNVQGMAPGINQILFYEGTSANPILNQMATDNIAKTISSSWGGGGFGTSSDTYFQQMATQGQSYLSATGDDGAFNRNTYGAPSLDPYITQVGGTELTVANANGAYSSEIGWDDSGGGYWISGISTSAKYTIPSWQTAAVNSTNKASAAYRNVPDIAAEANFDNPTADNGAFELGYGGTSFATPRMAGYIALANQQAVENGNPTLGFLNPALYTAGGSSSAANYYHDVASGTNPAASGTTVYTSVAGYDLVTGWGSPNGPGLLNYLAGTPAPDFALAPTGVSLQKGGSSVTASIPLTVYNGFEGTVTLTATGLPTGVTATYAAGSNSTAPTITLTADSTSTMATYNVTVTGTSGSLTHTAILPVTIMKRAADDFTISATAPSINLNDTGASTISVTEGAGLVGGISLTASGIPNGVTGTFSATTTPFATGLSTVTLTFQVAGYVTPGNYNITVTGTSAGNIVHTAPFILTVTTPASLLSNGGFETGTAGAWTFSNTVLLTQTSGIPPHNGTYFALFNGGSTASTYTATQPVTITAGSTTATLGAWYWVLSGETGTTVKDTLTFQLTDSSGNVLTTLGSVSNLTQNGYWAYLSYDVSAYIGQSVVVKVIGSQAGTTYTDFLLDDVSLVVK